MTIKPYVLLIIIAVSVAVGRFTAPEKIKIEKEVVEVESTSKEQTKDIKTDSRKDKRIEKVTTEIVRPDGTREITTRFVEVSSDTKFVDKSVETVTKTEKETKSKESSETTYNSSPVRVAVMTGPSVDLSNGLSLGNIVYGLSVSKRVLGPFNMGLFGMSNKVVGVSLGIDF